MWFSVKRIISLGKRLFPSTSNRYNKNIYFDDLGIYRRGNDTQDTVLVINEKYFKNIPTLHKL